MAATPPPPPPVGVRCSATTKQNDPATTLLALLLYCSCAARTLSTWRVFQTPLTVFHLCSSFSHSHFISTHFTISFLYFALSFTFLTCSIFSSISIEYFYTVFVGCLHIKLHLFLARFSFSSRLPASLPASFATSSLSRLSIFHFSVHFLCRYSNSVCR